LEQALALSLEKALQPEQEQELQRVQVREQALHLEKQKEKV
jgi:hypothetical protein